MIRSVALNLVLGLVGLLFIAAGIAYALEDTAWAGWRGLFHPHAFLLAALNLALGAWCTFGAFRNFRARRRSLSQPFSSRERAAVVVAGVMALSLFVLVACLWQAEGPNPSPAAFYRHAGRASAVVFLASLVAVPIVAAWSPQRKAP